MAAPATVDEFIELTRKSGVIDAKRLDAALQQATGTGSMPKDPTVLAKLLIREGVLTLFQAEQLLQGKWRGFTIGNFKVLERLGSGGMGNVFLCEHKVMRHRVAVKVLATVAADDPTGLKRFQREARAAAGLDHPNIVKAHDIGQADKLHFLVMDYVDGTCLHDLLKKHGPMDVLRASHYVLQAARGLQYAHESGLIHRDIKPANLILDRSGCLRILDMGIARFTEAEEEVLTRGPLGTADYLAPEQARDSHNVDPRVDIYSLGACFYTMLTDNLPLTGAKTIAQKLMFLQTREPKSIQLLRPEVPKGLCAVVEKMMAKDPAKRYQSFTEVIHDLEPWAAQPISPPPEEEMPRLSPALLTRSTAVDLGPTKEDIVAAGASSTKLKEQDRKQNRALVIGLAVVIVAALVGAGAWWIFLRPEP